MDRSPSQDPDSFYVQDCRQVQNNTNSIQTLTGRISRLVGTLRTDEDLERCRQMVQDAIQAANETRAILAWIREHQNQAQNASERNNRRMTYQKLCENLAVTARVLEDVVRQFSTVEQRYLEGLSAAGKLARGAGVDAGDGDVARGEEHQAPEMPMPDGGAGLDSQQEMQEDCCKVLRSASEDVRCLQRIYTELASAAEEQQVALNSLESHLASAAADVERGREEIGYSAKYAGRHAWLLQRMWTAAGGSLAVLAVVVLLTSS